MGPGYRGMEEADGTLVFTPALPAGRGLLIFHGALIKPRAYAGTAAFFASRGYLVYIPAGPARLSIRAVDAAAARLPSFGVGQWFLPGHSMGGFREPRPDSPPRAARCRRRALGRGHAGGLLRPPGAHAHAVG